MLEGKKVHAHTVRLDLRTFIKRANNRQATQLITMKRPLAYSRDIRHARFDLLAAADNGNFSHVHRATIIRETILFTHSAHQDIFHDFY